MQYWIVWLETLPLYSLPQAVLFANGVIFLVWLNLDQLGTVCKMVEKYLDVFDLRKISVNLFSTFDICAIMGIM